MGLKDRLREWAAEGFSANNASGSSAPNGAQRFGPYNCAAEPDPWTDLHQTLRQERRLLYGVYGEQFLLSPPDSHVLILGPTRKGKTAGVLVPMTLAAPGPTVSTSTRKDVLRTCAQSRSRLGRVWHLNLETGQAEPGTTPLRYSPITADFTRASAVAEAMCYAAEVNRDDKGSNSSYFAEQASRLIAPTLVAAALDNKPMDWVVEILLSQSAMQFAQVLDILTAYAEAPGAVNARRELSGILEMAASHGSANDIYATAARTFRVYNRPAVMAMTEEPNFDPAAFVAGNPSNLNRGMFGALDRQLAGVPELSIQERLPTGFYDTIFITAGGRTQDAVAPVIVGLLQALYDAAAAQKDRDTEASYYNRPPMVWALDEMASMSPWKDFPKALSTAAGDGVLIAAVFHDLSQVRDKWTDNTPGNLRTNMQTTVVFPGIQDQFTLKTLEETIGNHWVTTTSYGEQTNTGRSGGFFTGQSHGGSGTSYQESQQWLPIMDMGTISRGHPQDPNAVLMLGPALPYEGTLWAHTSPYYQAQPWPELLVATMAYFYEQVAPDDPRQWLPIPTLDLNNGQALWAGRDPQKASWLLDTYRWHKNYRQQRHLPTASATDA